MAQFPLLVNNNLLPVALSSSFFIHPLDSFSELPLLFLHSLFLQKFIPAVSVVCLERLAGRSDALGKLYEGIAEPILAVPPYSLGYPGKLAQSAYYPGDNLLSPAEIEVVSRALEERSGR